LISSPRKAAMADERQKPRPSVSAFFVSSPP
jgi:hypothetical protein